MKVVQDILFPMNILGKDRKAVKFDCTNVPTEGGRRGYKTINVVWTGEVMVESHTIKRVWYGGHDFLLIKTTYTDGNSSAITLILPDEVGLARVTVSDWIISFNCINVTSLIVNGEQLI